MLHTIGIQRFINKPCLERDIRKVLSYHSDTSKDSSFAPSLIPMDKIRKAKSLKILIAEDNEINQMVLSDMIKRNGHQFEIAKHGKIAADKASMSKYDLIFMDLQMPIMNGIEATKRIRVEDKKTPIIAMTSNIRESIKQECELAGMQDVLTKPITEATLVNILQTYAK
jgi:CheY-like chemotaxis protein